MPNINNGGVSTYLIVAFIIIFLIFSSLVYYTRNVLYNFWRSIYPVHELTGETPLQAALAVNVDINKSQSSTIDYSNNSATASSPSFLEAAPPKDGTVLEGPASSEQTWCLVGEDMAGRWCIQVKSPKWCEPIRTYNTKNKCETANDTPTMD